MNLIDAKLLWRDWRGGQLNLIVTALILAVMVVTAVSLLAERVERGLNEQISSFLAADLSVRGKVELPPDFAQQARQLGLQTAQVAQFRSMVFADDYSHLSAVKAVSHDYPLRGLISVTRLDDPQQTELLDHGPPAGEAWVDSRFINLLEVELGQSVEVGYSVLEITRIIVQEPDRGTGFSAAGARIMMSHLDLSQSQLIRPGSQVTHKLLLAGDEPAIRQFGNWFEQRARDNSHLRLVTPENSEQSLSEALERGRAFLLLSGTIGVLLAGLAMALASHRYAGRLTDQVALMKAWGQSAAHIRRSQFVRLSLIAISATAIGMLCGWVAHYLLLEVAKGLFDAKLPLPGWRPWIVASITGLVCVLAFALPALWHLPTIAPLKVLRRDLPDSLVSQGSRLAIGIVALLALTLWYSGSLVISALFLSTLFALFAVCALIALQFLKLVQRFGSWRGSYVRLGLANLWRRRSQTMIQLVGFAATLMLLLIVIGMRTNLISEWQAQLPEDAPSHFLFNVADAELVQVQGLLKREQIDTKEWYPMVRGRLISLNGETLSTEQLSRVDGLQREVNFTQTPVLPDSNKIVAGQWFETKQLNTQALAEFSMEQEVAQGLGVALGDVIEFSVGGIKFDARLSSIRTVDWQSMAPNFYIIFQPGALGRFSPNWLTSLRAEQLETTGPYRKQAKFISKLVRQYPTAVVIELSDIITQIRNVITRVTQGLELILSLVLACGALVLFAAIGVSFDERLRENAILRTLGSSRKIVLGALTIEYAALGAIAGLIAVFGSELVLYFVQQKVFNLDPVWHPNLWLLGLGLGISLITFLGLLRSREIITVPPLQSLRQID